MALFLVHLRVNAVQHVLDALQVVSQVVLVLLNNLDSVLHQFESRLPVSIHPDSPADGYEVRGRLA